MTNTPAPTFRVKEPVDLLAVVPVLLGFHPESSLVLVTFGTGPDVCHARVDLPDEPRHLPSVVGDLVRAAARSGNGRAAVVAYTDDPVPALAAAAALTRALAAEGVDVVAAVRADGHRWWSLDCDGPCCPTEGTPYDLSVHPITAQAVLEGRVTLASRGDLEASLVGDDPGDAEAVADAADRALQRWVASLRHPLGPPDPAAARAHVVAEGHWVRDRVVRFLGDGRRLDPVDAGRLLVALVAIEVRDVAWAEMAPGSAGAHVDLWRDLVRRAPRDLTAAPAALLGFAAWLSGDGALAWCAVDRCREVEPDYRLAELLATALTNAVPPSTWSPLPREQLTLFAG